MLDMIFSRMDGKHIWLANRVQPNVVDIDLWALGIQSDIPSHFLSEGFD